MRTKDRFYEPARPGAVAAAVASSEDPADRRASAQIMGPETELDASSGGKPAHQQKAVPAAHQQKAVPAAHLTFVIDCASGKQLSLAAPLVPLQGPSPYLGPVTPPMKTYILFCGDSQPHLTQEAILGGGHIAQARGTLPPCRETVAPASSPLSPLCPQGGPEAKGSPLKTMPTRYLAWETVTGLLKAFSSCVCGQED
ncbi:steroid receptor-associated and regulated protein [Myotis daubentonii]|uniref:steroid receptor-associated and regulated protein n=1 Tax=Myotis daubentonii TaxID=98922 RepID=UPI002873F36C|nr:steroid receptor-associated and regulated protein [Myotis daubentonii]